MSSIQRSQPFTPVQTQPVTGTPQRVPTTTTPPQTGPSSHVQHQVQQSQSQTQSLGQVTSQTMQQSGQQQISQSSPQTVTQQHQQSSSVLGQTRLGQKLNQVIETTSQTQVGQQVGKVVNIGSKGHELLETQVMGTSIGDHIDNGLETVTGKFEGLGKEMPTVETRVFEHVTGISSDTVETGKKGLDYVKKGMQTANTLKSIHTAYQSGSVTGPETQTALLNSYKLLGGDKTIDCGEKILSCCQNPSIDTLKDMTESLSKLATDDSYASQLTHTALSTGTSMVLGSGTTSVLSSSVPILGFGTTVIDTGLALKKGYDWYHGQNNVSGLDVTKSVITAIGSGAGSTVAPVVGPLLATGVNLGIDVGVKTYDLAKTGLSYLSGLWS